MRYYYYPLSFFCLSLGFKAKKNSIGFKEGSYRGLVAVLIFESNINFGISWVLWILALFVIMVNLQISWELSYFLKALCQEIE